MDPATTLAMHISIFIDFRSPGRQVLEQYFLERVGDDMGRNPKLSPAAISSLMTFASADSMVNLLSRNVLSDEQREWLFVNERRFVVWTAFLEHQYVSAEDLGRILSFGLGEPVATFVALRPARFSLDERADYEDILNGANECSKVHALESSEPELFVARLKRWASSLHDFDDNADCVSQLIERRPEMLDAMLASGAVALRRGIASSRHCVTTEQQLIVAGIDASAKPFSVRAIDQWLCAYGRTLLSLVNNPRATTEVLHAIASRLVLLRIDGTTPVPIDISDDALGHLKAVGRSVNRRVEALAGVKPTVVGDYESIKDTWITDWLVKRSLGSRNNSNMRWHDVAALQKNRYLSPASRSALDQARGSEREVLHDERRSSDLRPKATAVQFQRLVEQNRPKISGINVTSLTTLHVQAFQFELEGDSTGSCAVAEWLVTQLGADPRSWTTFFGLASDWEGPVDELVSTAIILAKSAVAASAN